jgi:hypothetical protein
LKSVFGDAYQLGDSDPQVMQEIFKGDAIPKNELMLWAVGHCKGDAKKKAEVLFHCI